MPRTAKKEDAGMMGCAAGSRMLPFWDSAILSLASVCASVYICLCGPVAVSLSEGLPCVLVLRQTTNESNNAR